MLANFLVTMGSRRILTNIRSGFLIGVASLFGGSLLPTASVYAARCGVGAVEIGCALKLGDQCISKAFPTLGALFTSMVRLGLFAAALLFFAMVVWGGFRYLNAGGEPENVQAARKTLTSAGIGLVIVVVALVVNQIVYQIFDLGRTSVARPGPLGTMRISCEQQTDLEKRLPVRTPNYFIDYQKKNDIFIVTIQQEPVKENALKVVEWFKSQGVKDHCDLKIGWTATMEIIKQGKLQPTDFPLCVKEIRRPTF